MASSNGTNGAHQDPEITIPLQINGKETAGHKTIPITNPSTGKTCWYAGVASPIEASQAVAAAAAAYPTWSRTSPTSRRDIFLRAASLLEERAADLQDYMATETGAQPAMTEFNTTLTAGMLRDIAGRLVGELGGKAPVCQDSDRSALVLKEPYGVVLAMAPWNAPYILGMRSIAYPLAAGNTVVLKGSELSPRSHWALGKLFADAGLPEGALNVVISGRDEAAAVTRTLIEDKKVKKVNFTGSTAVGSIVAEMSGKALKPCLMELGGKNGVVVCEDADLEEAAKWSAIGAFHHSGQICMSTDLVFVHRPVVDKFSKLLKEATAKMYPDSAILVTPSGAKKVRDITQDALDKGAGVVYGDPGKPQESETRLRPIIIDNVSKDMNMYDQEAFGPVVGIVPIDHDQEAIDILNHNGYGLSSSIFTKDLGRAFRIGKTIESGAIHINDMTVHDEPNLGHGGWGSSGWGRFNAADGFAEFLREKTITWKGF